MMTSIFRAPASMLFSTSSFTTEAGRSITSPAATWLARISGNSRMRLIVFSILDCRFSIAKEKRGAASSRRCQAYVDASEGTSRPWFDYPPAR